MLFSCNSAISCSLVSVCTMRIHNNSITKYWRSEVIQSLKCPSVFVRTIFCKQRYQFYVFISETDPYTSYQWSEVSISTTFNSVDNALRITTQFMQNMNLQGVFYHYVCILSLTLFVWQHSVISYHQCQRWSHIRLFNSICAVTILTCIFVFASFNVWLTFYIKYTDWDSKLNGN